jgi:hypothetical protein
MSCSTTPARSRPRPRRMWPPWRRRPPPASARVRAIRRDTRGGPSTPPARREDDRRDDPESLRAAGAPTCCQHARPAIAGHSTSRRAGARHWRWYSDRRPGTSTDATGSTSPVQGFARESCALRPESEIASLSVQRTTATPAKTSAAATAIRESNDSWSTRTPRATAITGLI